MTIQQLETVKTRLSLASSPDFSRLLAGNKHNPDLPAPPLWRGLLSALHPFRFDYVNGVACTEHVLRFYWYCSEFGSAGTPEQVIGVIKDLLREQGFTAHSAGKNEYGVDEYVFIKQDRDTEHNLTVEGVERFIGTREPRCGGRLLYEINMQTNGARPTVRETLKAFPWLACPELPATLLDFFNDKAFSSLNYGGTWTRYYDWGLTIPCATPEAAAEMLARLDGLLAGLGFFPEKKDADILIYHPAQSYAPIIYLDSSEKTVVAFRIQPYS